MGNRNDSSGIIIKVITVLGSFVGSGFLLTFFFAQTLFREPKPMLVLALLLLGISVYLTNKVKLLVFDASFIALMLYSGVIMGVGLNGMKVSASMICYSYCIVGIVCFIFSDNEIQKLIAILTSFMSIGWIIHIQKWAWLFHLYNLLLTAALLYLLLNEASLLTNKYFTQRFTALKYACMIMFLTILSTISLNKLPDDTVPYTWLSSIVIIVSILWLIKPIATLIGVTGNKIIYIQIIVLLVLMPTMIFPAISGTLLLVLLCFKINDLKGWVIGLICLLYFIIQFYYDLTYNLLIKSELLLITGFFFAFIYFLFQKKIQINEKV